MFLLSPGAYKDKGWNQSSWHLEGRSMLHINPIHAASNLRHYRRILVLLSFSNNTAFEIEQARFCALKVPESFTSMILSQGEKTKRRIYAGRRKLRARCDAFHEDATIASIIHE